MRVNDTGRAGSAEPEADAIYESGRNIAKNYISFYGRHEMNEAFKNLSAVIHLRPTKDAKDVYRKIDQKDLKRAWSGFYDVFVEEGMLSKDVPAHRNQASLKFHSDWVLATARADGEE
ncbi:MAG: hypothetical protein QXD77_01950 [Candidatus Aenigmatarchaeota archaeon]